MEPHGIALVVDYQNAHTTGHQRFGQGNTLAATLLEPTALAREVERARARGLDHYADAFPPEQVATRFERVELIHVHRGIPSASRNPAGHSYVTAQADQWSSRPGVEVYLKTLQYIKEPTCAHDPTPRLIAREKGVDVAVAVDAIDLARSGNYKAVIVFSQDRDLTDAIQRANASSGTFVEAAGWAGFYRHEGVWNTFLPAHSFAAARDPHNYKLDKQRHALQKRLELSNQQTPHHAQHVQPRHPHIAP